MPTIVERIPRVRKTQKALRGLGYKFNSSVDDLIDNFISANAENIKIYFPYHHATLESNYLFKRLIPNSLEYWNL